MKLFSLALVGLCGCFGFSAPAHADDLPFGDPAGVRDARFDARLRRGSFAVEPGARPFAPSRGSVVIEPVRTRAPRIPAPFRPVGPSVVPAPAFPTFPTFPTYPMLPRYPGPVGGHDGRHGHGDEGDCDCARVHIPAHTVCRQETVCVPAVYEDRCVPVYDVRCVPIFETVCVPVTAWVTDPRTGRRHEVVVGERKEQVQVGERKERVQVGERHERVLVRAETTRIVTRHELVPGRTVTLCDDRHHRHEGEVLTSEAYGREMAAIERSPRADGFETAFDGFEAGAGPARDRRGPGRGEGRRDDGWYTGDRR